MIETKMRSLLSRNERRVLRKLAQAYASAQLNINQFVEALLHLLSSTPEKVNTSTAPPLPHISSNYFYLKKKTHKKSISRQPLNRHRTDNNQ